MIVDNADAKAEVTQQFEAYEAALMANDIAALDRFFWPSPLALRFGAGESLFGFEAIAAFRVARAGGSPARELRATQITCFDTKFAVATTEFLRAGEARIGRQTQVWVKFPDLGWRIVSAHVSLVAEKS
jgi:ketosteroid isomerase-like protein